MSAIADDVTEIRVARGDGAGLLAALVSATSFGLSGPLARGLLDTGWSPGAVVLVRVALGAIVLAPLGVASLRGRAAAVRRNVGLVLVYGVMAVAACQFCYFSAVRHMQVGPALLIEYAAPLLVVAWMWLRHGHRPGRVTLLGAALAVVGLVLVLDLVGGASVSVAGVLWAVGAMVSVTAYFVINGDDTTGLPPLALAWLGLVVGAAGLALLGVTGLMPLHGGGGEVAFADGRTPWWLPVLLLGVVTAALSYATGVVAGRRLGSRVSSFLGLFEVLAAVLFSWLLLGELPGPVQLAGGLLVLAGVVAVRLGESGVAAPGTPEATGSA